MRKATLAVRARLAAVFFGLFLAVTVNGAVVYDNTIFDLEHRFSIGTTEIGDEINLNLSGGHKYLTLFSFEYWGTSTTPGGFAGNVQVKAKLYSNDGPLFNGYASPGSVLWESTWYGITPTGRSTMNYLVVQDFPGPGIFLPSSKITLGVQFQGLGAGDEVGIDCYFPSVIGTGYNDYWENDNGVWKLRVNDSGPISIGARFVAVVPEPSSLALGIVGALAVLGSRRRN